MLPRWMYILSRRNPSKAASGIVSRNFEPHQICLKAPGFHGAICDADRHPDGAEKHGVMAEVSPNEQADDKTEERRDKIRPVFFLGSKKIAHKSGGIHSHECDQRAKVQQLRTLVITDQESSNQRERADENHVVSWNVMLGIHGAEKPLRNSIASPHAIEQTGRSELSAHS